MGFSHFCFRNTYGLPFKWISLRLHHHYNAHILLTRRCFILLLSPPPPPPRFQPLNKRQLTSPHFTSPQLSSNEPFQPTNVHKHASLYVPKKIQVSSQEKEKGMKVLLLFAVMVKLEKYTCLTSIHCILHDDYHITTFYFLRKKVTGTIICTALQTGCVLLCEYLYCVPPLNYAERRRADCRHRHTHNKEDEEALEEEDEKQKRHVSLY